MDSLFITNAAGQPNLKKRINRLTEEAEELKFLVGFFYFSGITELYQGLLKNDHVILKILVGLNIDKKNNQEGQTGTRLEAFLEILKSR